MSESHTFDASNFRCSGGHTITTKYLGPSNSRGSRVKASAEGLGSVTIAYDPERSSPENHMQAARVLEVKLGWNAKLGPDTRPTQWLGGDIGSGYVFVRVSHPKAQ